MLAEYPLAQEKLALLDAKVARLCERHEIPVPTPENPAPVIVDDHSLQKVRETVEKNRAMMRHVIHECHDSQAHINRSVKQAKAAFVW